MREGLRSGKGVLKSSDCVDTRKKPVAKGKQIADEADRAVSGSVGEKTLYLVSVPDAKSLELKDEKKSAGLEEGFEGRTVGEGGVKVGSADTARKRKFVDSDGEGTRNRGKRKAKRRGSSDLKVIQVFGRVLRSSATRSDGCIKKTKSDEILRGTGKDGDAEKKQVVEANESTELDRKRGRTSLEENGEGHEELEKPVASLERPSKVEEEECCDLSELDGEMRKKKKDGPGSPRKEECDLSKSDCELTKENDGHWRSQNYPGAVKEDCDLSKPDSGLGEKKKKDGRGRPRKYPLTYGAINGLPKLDGKFGKKKDGRGRPRKYPLIDGPVKEDSDLLKLDVRLEKKKDGRGRPRKYPVINGPVKEDSDLQKLDGRLVKKKDGRGRPRKYPVTDGAAKLDLGIPRNTQEGSRDLTVERQGIPRKVQQSIQGIMFGRAYGVENKVLKPLISDGRPKNKLKYSNAGLLKSTEHSNDADQKVEMVLKLRDDDEVGPGTRDNVSSSENMCTIMDTLRLKNKRKGVSGKCMDSEKGEGERARSELKQSIRDKLVKILLSAGWSIQLRPRQNKDYLDSVYVSLSGRTHWSVTLAYRMLKQHYENGTGESSYYKTGFQFTALPDDEIEILKKVMGKRRSGKKTPNTMEDDESENIAILMNKKRQRQKLLGKPKRGRPFLSEQGKSASNRDRSQKKLQNGKQRTLLVRKAMEEADSVAGGYIPYAGNRTVLAWMIDLGTVSLNSKVRYINQSTTGVSLEGKISRDGILCDCCNQTLTLSDFEIHSGSELREPLENICLESGIPLSQCVLDSWNMQPETDRQGFHHIDVDGDDPNDDTCGICGDGGDLICCDGCPSTFHQSCLDIQKFPSGRWHCAYCSCKFCKMVGGHEHDEDNLAAIELYTCQLCEEKYHPLCSSVNVSVDIYSNSSYLCGEKCTEIYENLKKLLGIKHDLGEGFSCTLIRRFDVSASTPVSDESQRYDVVKQIECNSKLAVALLVLDECFLPMLDNRSGINLIRNIVYNFWSNFKRLNYSGFLTIVLQRGDEVVSAATIRIHGNKLAEMPFIGTRYIYRRQGMCRRLLSGIESILCSLGVEKLVIPAISELEQTWTSVFGFMPLEASTKATVKDMNLLVFPGVQMLQKSVLKSEIPEENLTLLEGPSPNDLKEQDEERIIFEDAVSDLPIEAVEPSLSLSNGSSTNADRTNLVDLNMADHNLGDSGEIIVKPAPIDCSTPKQREDITIHQKGSFGSAMALGIISNERRVSDHEATDNGGTVRCASGDDDNGDVKAKEYNAVTDYTSNSVRNSEALKKAGSHESELSFEKVVCHDSVAQSAAVPHHLKSRDRATTVQTSLSLGGIYSTVENCSKDSSSYHLICPISEEKPHDVGSRVNGVETHNEPTAGSNAGDPSREGYLERNGHCNSKEVMSDSLGVVLKTLHD